MNRCADINQRIAQRLGGLRSEQVWWQDPESGYKRRTLTPPGISHHLQLSEVHFPPGARVTFENAPGPPSRQQIWILEGTMQVHLGQRDYRLTGGDCMVMTLDQPVILYNPGPGQARYVAAL
ncbi:MAG: cupin domain-containing protein [Steroidobacteraceae bacterium]